MKTNQPFSVTSQWLCLAGLICLPLLTASCDAAQPARPAALREEAQRLENKARELKADGRHEAAQAAQREADELRARADRARQPAVNEDQRAQSKAELMELQAGLERARAEGRGEEAKELERQIERVEGRGEEAKELERQIERVERQLSPRRPAEPRERIDRGERPRREPDGREGPGPQQMGERERRIHHLEVAIENLHAAGLHEPAERLAQDLERARREGAARQDAPREPAGGEIQALRNEVRELRAAVQELRNRLEERDRRER